MVKVVCSVPESRFAQYNISFPEDWEVVFIQASDENFLANIKGADFIFSESMNTVSATVINAADNLKMIHTQGVGFNYVDVDAAAKKGIYVCNNKSVNMTCVAEHTVGLMLASLRHIIRIDRGSKEGRFEEVCLEYRRSTQRELSDCHVGIVGFGAIGREVARLLAPFEPRMSYYDAYRPSKEIEEQLNISYLPMEEIFKQCDVISLHVPILPDTVDLINKDTIAMMRPDALIVNCARGEIVNSEDLAAALENGRIFGAALDTVYPEPPDENHPLMKLSPEAKDRLIITAHIAGTSDKVFRNMLNGAINNMKRIVAGERPVNIQNGL